MKYTAFHTGRIERAKQITTSGAVSKIVKSDIIKLEWQHHWMALTVKVQYISFESGMCEQAAGSSGKV